MAQQLATLRTPAAYAGVAAYAHSHTGEAAAAADLALGHAYLLDKRYAEAEAALAQARRADGELSDYADFLDAEASHDAGDDPVAENILHGFTSRYPESIFDDQAPELEANVLLAMNNLTGARQVLAAAAGTDAADRAGFAGTVRDLGAVWISNEAPFVFPDIAARLAGPVRRGPLLLAVNGEPTAWTDPHGAWVDWIGSERF